MSRYTKPADLARTVAKIGKKPPALSLRTRAEARRGQRDPPAAGPAATMGAPRP